MSGVIKVGSVLAALVGATAFAFADDVDWKMYGGASVDETSFCFFDAKGVTRTNDGHVRVWTKCLFEKDLERVDDKTDRGNEVFQKAARNMAMGYVPPIVLSGRLKPDQIPTVILYEQVADLGDIEPPSRILLELNCSEKLVRRLSTHIKSNGREGFDEKPSAWENVPPETNVALLQKILCR